VRCGRGSRPPVPVRDVGAPITGAAKARKRIATFALGSEVRYASAADRYAFAHDPLPEGCLGLKPVEVAAEPLVPAVREEPANAVSALVSEYHDATAADGGREHRVLEAVHTDVRPRTTTSSTTTATTASPADEENMED
jgi:hypothetical protein